MALGHEVIEHYKFKAPVAHTLYMASLCIFTAVPLKQYLPQMHREVEKWAKISNTNPFLKNNLWLT